MNYKRFVVILLIFIIALITVGYAYLTQTLNVSGSATAVGNTWDVHFENPVITTGSATTTVPTITDNTTVTFTTSLTKPGDYFEFTIDVVNKGTIDAMVDSINLGTLTAAQATLFDYTVTYSDGTEIKNKDLLEAGTGKETLLVSLYFKDSVTESQLSSSDIDISITSSIIYVQNSDGVEVIHPSESNMVITAPGTTADVGEILNIDSERFYVISNDGIYVKALAEWNLLVGNQYNPKTFEEIALTNPTGLQDSSSRGWIYDTPGEELFSSLDTNIRYGVFGIESEYYYDGNIIDSYADSYKDKLTALGGKIIDVSVITNNELDILGCDTSNNTCIDAPTWVYQTCYYTSNLENGTNWSYFVLNNGVVSGDYRLYSIDQNAGFRPLITVLASNIRYQW